MTGITSKKHQLDFFELVSGLFILLMILLIIVVSLVSEQNIFFVLVGFFPTILVIILSMLIHEQYANFKNTLWLIPVIVVGLFYFIGHSNVLFSNQFDIDLLTGVNFVFSIIYMLIVISVFLNDFEFKKIISRKKTVSEKKSLQDYVHSIEDKSKALNFAIGRVYNKYHGGSQEIRDKLKIPSDWYNEFSLIGVGTDKIDLSKLEELITRFELQLKLFEKTELEVFKDKISSLKNLIRDVKGSDKIIEVLDHNDKDPVKSYYKGALEFCAKIKEEIRSKSLKIVKNDYIPKDEEDLAKILHKPVEEIKNSEKSSSTKTLNSEKDSKPKHLHP